MSGVKQSQAAIFSLCASIFVLTGCASEDLARFAPPGIVKFEDLAGDQPVNPAVAERIEERRKEKDAGKFPRLAETPDKGDRPAKTPMAEIETETAGLVNARDALAQEVAADRAAAETELSSDLAAESDELKALVDADSAAAARERREKLTHPDPEQ